MDSMLVDSHTTVHTARSWLSARLGVGARCPVCKQLAKVYKRPLTAGMATFLIRADYANGAEWFHVQDFIESDKPTRHAKVAGDFAKLRFWGLIEEESVRRPDGGRGGWWRITPMGRQFARGDLAVSKYVSLYDSALVGFAGPEIFIQSAFRTPFNYGEIMADSTPI